MRIGLSILLIAVGAILRFALETSVEGINLGMTGVILMVVGGIGLIASLLVANSQTRRGPEAADQTVVHETTTTTERDIV